MVFGATAGAAFLATPLVRWLAVRVGAIDHPSDRKVHPKPTPTLGGLGIYVALLVGLWVAYMTPEFREVFDLSSEPRGALLAATVLVALGVYDDVKGMSAPAKLAGQILAGGLLILNGVQLVYFWLPGAGSVVLSGDLAVPLTLLWVIAMVNAVNLIDGLDGLACGVVFLAAAAFFVYAFQGQAELGTPTSALFAAIVAGAAIGFLPFNFHPARIFMGDSGSMLLGVLLAVSTISGVGRTVRPFYTDLTALALPVVLPLLVLAVPFIDVLFAIVRRMRQRRPVTHPDKEHIHHRLLEIGHSHRQAVLLIYLWSVLIAGAALAVTFVKDRTQMILVVSGALVAFLGTALPRLRRPSPRRSGGRHAGRRYRLAPPAGPSGLPVSPPAVTAGGPGEPAPGHNPT